MTTHSPYNAKIVAHLVKHGRCTLAQLDTVFKEPKSFYINPLKDLQPRSEWLKERIACLRKLGRVTMVIDADVVYFDATKADATPAQPELPSDELPDTARPAPSASYDFRATNYVPKPSTGYRPGSLDFLSCPSVAMGRTVDYASSLKPARGGRHG
ncbi:MAG: hypothetical protein ACKVOT_14225 [Polaromonas sp.]